MVFSRSKKKSNNFSICAFVLGIWGAICGGTISSSCVGATIGLVVAAILCNLTGIIVRRASADVFLLIQIAFAIVVNQWIQNGFDKCIVVFVAFILPVGFAIHLKEKRNNERKREKQERKRNDLLAWIAVDEQIPQKQI